MGKMTMEQIEMERTEMERMFPKISSNSSSTDTKSPGTLDNASNQSGTSSKTSPGSAGPRNSVNWDNSSSSSYDADDEGKKSGEDPVADDSDQSDGSRSPPPMLNEQGVPFFIRNENAETEMGLYNLRKKKKDAAACMKREERGRKLFNQKRLLNFFEHGEPQPYYHPSKYIDTNTFGSPLAKHERPLTSPKLKASDPPSTPKGRSKARMFS